jgi:hypothetical protein
MVERRAQGAWIHQANMMEMTQDKGEKAFDYSWDYCSVIGKMNYLEKSTHCDLAFSVHQCAQFMSQPMRVHGEAVKQIGRYLLGTRGKKAHCDARHTEIIRVLC